MSFSSSQPIWQSFKRQIVEDMYTGAFSMTYNNINLPLINSNDYPLGYAKSCLVDREG